MGLVYGYFYLHGLQNFELPLSVVECETHVISIIVSFLMLVFSCSSGGSVGNLFVFVEKKSYSTHVNSKDLPFIRTYTGWMILGFLFHFQIHRSILKVPLCGVQEEWDRCAVSGICASLLETSTSCRVLPVHVTTLDCM